MKPINNFTDYFITEEGEVYSMKYGKKRLLKQQEHYKGYKVVSLTVNNKKTTLKIHRLVACAFLPNPENKEQVNHIDGNKKNNHVSNLEWSTQSENQIHAHRTGLMKDKVLNTIKRFSKPVIDKNTNQKYDSLKQACLQNNLKYKAEFYRMKYANKGRFQYI